MSDLVENNNRIFYVEPTNLNFNDSRGVGTIQSTTRINNDYEDYCVVVDLEVEVYDRRSCGGLDGEGHKINIVYTTQRDNKSFFTGTDGKLTTNYTDISTVIGSESNTTECLGLESLNISYQSWMYPEVTARFVDVRGASVMLQEEEQLHGDVNKSSMYKAFFTFPYPMFKLKVKGFYGKGATFYLTVEDVKISFDSNSGNFVFDVKFIGMMYRIYTDIPMLYCCVAPYMSQGVAYWDEQVSNNIFVFKQKDNSISPMIKFPELIAKIYSIDSNQSMIDSKAAEAAETENLEEKTNTLSAVSKIPFLDQENAFLFDKPTGDNKIVVYVEKTTSEWDTDKNNIEDYLATVKKCDETFGTTYSERLKSLENISPFVDGTAVKKTTDGIQVITSPGVDMSEYQEDINKVTSYIQRMDDVNEVLIYAFHVKNDDYHALKADIDNKVKTSEDQKSTIRTRYQQEQDEIIESILGFCPSVKNFYNLAFAHMDTFMHCYNEMLGCIKEEMDNGSESRDPQTYGFNNTDDTYDTSIITDLVPSIQRIPPFPAIYKKESITNTGISNQKLPQVRTVEQWPGDLTNGNKLLEVDFVKELLTAAKMYIEEMDKIKEALEAAKNTQNGEESGQTSNGLSFNAFIPLNNVDLVLNGGQSNPYLAAKSLALSNDAGFLGTVISTLANRLFIYISCNQSVHPKEAGKIEAINLYKAFGSNINSNEFVQFLQHYIIESADKDLYTSIVEETEDLTVSLNFTEGCSKCNKTLYASNGTYLEWNLYVDGKKNPMPATVSTLSKMKQDFTANSFPTNGLSYINTASSGMTNSDFKTFTLIEDGQYFKKYGEKLKTEIEIVQSSRPAQPQPQQQEGSEESSDSDASEDTGLSFFDPTDVDYMLEGYKTEMDEVPYQTYLQDLFKKKNDEGKFETKATDDDIKNVFNGEMNRQDIAFFHSTNFATYTKNAPNSWGTTFQTTKNNYGRAYLFLLGFPWSTDGNNTGFIDRNVNNGIALKSRLLLAGAFYYRREVLKNNSDIITLDPAKNYKVADVHKLYVHKNKRQIYLSDNENDYSNFIWPRNWSSERGRVLAEYFRKWVDNKFSKVVSLIFKPNLYKNFETKELNLDLLTGDSTSADYQEAKTIQDFLRDTFLTTVTEVEVYTLSNKPQYGTTPNNKHSKLLAPVTYMKDAMDGFKEALRELYKNWADKIESDSNTVSEEIRRQDASDPFKNKDIKLSTYITLKNLYDKWLARPYKGPDTWKYVDVDTDTTTDSDFKSFVYIDSLYHDIGYQILANTNRVAEWISSCMPSSELNGSYGSSVRVSKSVFEYLSEIAQHTGGMLIAFPQKLGSTTEDMPSMFQVFPFESNGWAQDSSSFVYMYTYKPSEHIGTDQFSDDGILDLTAQEIKDTFSDDGYYIPAFGVSFGKQNQSIFKNITLNTESTTTTEASIAAASAIASKGSEAPQEASFFGQDLYKVRTSYSYECSFEMMGNIQIMPLMYFQLNNVPFWRGAYMIFKVSHSITPGNMVTTVTGTRINKYSLPLSDGAVLRSKSKNGAGSGSGSYGANGPNYQGQFVEDETYTPKSGVADTLDFDKTKVDATHPVICITPAYGPNMTDKTASWKISYDLVENHIIKKLKTMTYKDGRSFNVQMCNKDGNHTNNTECLMSQTEGIIQEVGANAVISVVPRFSAGSSNYFKVFYGGKNAKGINISTDESKKLADFFIAEVKEMITKQSNYKTMTDGMMSNNQTSGVLSSGETKEKDYGPSLACASVVTFNWFDGYPSSEICRKALTRTALEKTTGYKTKKANGRYFISQGWLDSNEGKEAIAQMHVNAIKKYVDSLQ